MRLLLVNPWHVSTESDRRDYPMEPLGLLSLASFLHASNAPCQTRILDAHMEGPAQTTRTEDGWRSGMTDREFMDVLDSWQPDAVGITCNYTFGAATVFKMAALLKRWGWYCHTIIGGAHATLDAENIAERHEVDTVVAGEGELALADIVRRWGNAWIPKIVRAEKPAEITALPAPSREYVDYRRYLDHPAYFHTLQSPVGTMFTSRGCPFHCMFCSTQAAWGNTWRGRTAEQMAEEALYLRSVYGVKEIAFQDDQLLGSPQRMAEFCRLMIGRGMTFIAPPGMSPCKLSPELIDLMARAGFYRLCFSVDAGTQRVAGFIKKPILVKNVRALVRHAHRRGMWTYGTLVIGHPTETRAEIVLGIKRLWNMKLDFLRVYIAQPHIGSELFTYWESRGKVNREDILEGHNILKAKFGNGELSAEELEQLRNRGEAGYIWRQLLRMLNPLWWLEVFPVVKGFRRLAYALKAVAALPAVRQKTKP